MSDESNAPEGKWAIKRRARRAEVLAVAERILVDEGVESLSVHRIAREMACTPGALYRYFSSRTELLMTLEAQNLDVLRQRFRAGAARVADPEAQLDDGLLALLAYVSMYAALPRVLPQRLRLISLLFGDPRIVVPDDAEVAPALAATQALLGDVEAMLARAVARDRLDAGPGARRAMALWTSVHGATTISKMGRFEHLVPVIDGLPEEIAEQLLLSWGAPPEDLSEHRARIADMGGGDSLLQV